MPAPRADVDDVRIRRRDRDGADRASGLAVEDRHPVGAVVGRPPHAAVVESDVEHVRLACRAGRRARASRARGPDIAPAHLAELKRPVLWRALRLSRRRTCAGVKRRQLRGDGDDQNHRQGRERKWSAHE